MAPTSLDGLLALKQPTRLPAKFSFAHHARRTSTAPARSRRQHRQDSDQEPSRSSSQERAERKAEVRAAKRAAKEEALEREWKVQQVAGELGRQADLLERHRYLVAKYGGPQALGHLDVRSHTCQVILLLTSHSSSHTGKPHLVLYPALLHDAHCKQQNKACTSCIQRITIITTSFVLHRKVIAEPNF